MCEHESGYLGLLDRVSDVGVEESHFFSVSIKSFFVELKVSVSPAIYIPMFPDIFKSALALRGSQKGIAVYAPMRSRRLDYKRCCIGGIWNVDI